MLAVDAVVVEPETGSVKAWASGLNRVPAGDDVADPMSSSLGASGMVSSVLPGRPHSLTVRNLLMPGNYAALGRPPGFTDGRCRP